MATGTDRLHRGREKARTMVDARQPMRRMAAGLWLLPAVCLGLGGCANFWDDVTARDFNFKAYFFGPKPDPLVVLRDTTDGNKRARALASLKEPHQTGGSDA